MKKYLPWLISAVLATAIFSFTSLKFDARKTSYYWFKLNAVTGKPKKSIGLPPFQADDPLGCSGGPNFCAGAYPGCIDNGDGTYSAGGSRQITEMMP